MLATAGMAASAPGDERFRALGFGEGSEEHDGDDAAVGNAGIVAIADDPFGCRSSAAGRREVAMLHEAKAKLKEIVSDIDDGLAITPTGTPSLMRYRIG
jgi:hypothetical protein